MTAVLEPQQTAPAAHTPGRAAVAPLHCGAEMLEVEPLDSLAWAYLPSGLAEWACPCGFRLDAGVADDPLLAVRTSSARVESLQWELDAAQEHFEQTLRTAAALGAGRAALSMAAGLPAAELAELLR